MKNSSKIYQTIDTLITPYLKSDMKALEIGCGTGQLSFLIHSKVESLTATDFSSEMIRICKKNNNTNIHFKVEDGASLSFDDASFDVVIIANVLHIVDNPDSVLQEIKRVMKPDGLMIASIYTTEKDSSHFKLWFLKKIGFQVTMQVTSKEFIEYIKSMGFNVIFDRLIQEDLDECLIIARV